jgi:hypothetical protein
MVTVRVNVRVGFPTEQSAWLIAGCACAIPASQRHSFIELPLHFWGGSFFSLFAVAAARDSERITKEIWGDTMGWVPWQRPGFDLGLRGCDWTLRD